MTPLDFSNAYAAVAKAHGLPALAPARCRIQTRLLGDPENALETLLPLFVLPTPDMNVSDKDGGLCFQLAVIRRARQIETLLHRFQGGVVVGAGPMEMGQRLPCLAAQGGVAGLVGQRIRLVQGGALPFVMAEEKERVVHAQ